MSRIILKTEHRKEIAKHGEALYPQECRGLLLGHRNGLNNHVEDLIFFNSSTERDGHRYDIPSQQLLDAEEAASAKGLEVIGSFHSHVDQPARPSIHDREYVEPTFSYVIVGVRQGRAHELAAWQLSDDGTAFLQLDIRGAIS